MIAMAHWLLPLIWAYPVLAGAVDPHEHWQRADYLVESFAEIALKNEYSAQGRYVKKWGPEGIRYHYIHRVDDDRLHEELSELHLKHLQTITGLAIQPTRDQRQANLLIVFSREDSLKNDLRHYFDMKDAVQQQQFFRRSVCLGRFATDAQGTIRSAVVIIPVDRARAHAKLVDCIVEELTQVLGLANDSDQVFPSIFNDRSVDGLLSGLDYVLLKILYDARLQPGMNADNALPIVREIVAELFERQVISRAHLLVQQGGLYPLLY